MAASKQIFFVTSGRLAVYQWRNGHFGHPLVFMADEPGLSQFALYLERAPREDTCILVDFVEEEFREDTIPHVLGPDRRALIRTKQNRLFRNPVYSHAIFQGRQAEGRRDDKMLFTALIRPDLLSPWMGQIAERKVALTGIYSLPLLSAQLHKVLKIESSRALIVSLQSAGGLRQTFFLDGQLKLSRLAMMPQVQDRGYASYVLSEVEKIRRYLNSLRMLLTEMPLDVYLLGDAQLLRDMGYQAAGADNVRHHLHDLSDLAHRLKIKGEYSSRYADRIFAHLLARSSPPNQYANAQQRKYYKMYRLRAGMRAASLTLLLGSALWGAVKFVEGISAARESDSVGAQVKFYSERYRRARARLPDTPADSQDLRQAVELAAALGTFKTWPLPMLLALSEGLHRYPDIRIENLEWQSTLDSGSRSENSAGNAFGPQLRVPRRAGGKGRTPDGDRKVYQLALVKGRVAPFSGDYRAALEMVRNFADALRSQPAISAVKVIALPLDIGSKNRLAGNASADVDKADAPFEIQVVLLERDLGTG